MKVRVNSDCPSDSSGYKYRGTAVEVGEYKASPDCWEIFIDGKRKTTVYKKFCSDPLPEFEPKSGMTFKTSSGQYGLFVGTEKGLIGLLNTNCNSVDTYQLWFTYKPSMLTGASGITLDIIYNGMNEDGNAGSHGKISNPTTKIVWQREKIETVKLTNTLNAIIKGNGISINGEEVPVKHLLDIIYRFEQAQNCPHVLNKSR